MGARYILPSLAAVLAFASVAAILLSVVPGELRPVDYFLCGTAGTLVGCVALFLGVARMSGLRDLFYKRRR